MVLENILNPILNPLLNSLGYFWTLVILVVFINFIFTLIYKYTTNQNLMKDLKEEQKELQRQSKELRNDPKKMMEVQKKMMEINGKYMMHSFKPMIFTFLPIIIFFGWMSLHLAYYPIMPGQEFYADMNFNDGVSGYASLNVPKGINLTVPLNQSISYGQAKWLLKGNAGEYVLDYEFEGKHYSNNVLITNEKTYIQPLTKIKKESVKSLNIEMKRVLFNFGIFELGWLWTYILFSIIASIVIKKIMKVY